MKTKQDTALKLLQKYADSHELLQKENSQLKHMLEDFQKNLKINKEIISNIIHWSSNKNIIDEIDISSTFFISKIHSNNVSHSNIHKTSTKEIQKDSFLSILTSLQEENHNLNQMINENFKITEELRRRLFVSESVAIERKSDITKQNDQLKNRIFLLENSLMKKDSQILSYKEKYTNLSDTYNRKGYVEREIICIDPAESILAIQVELVLYKSSYDGLATYCNNLKNSLYSSEKANNRLMDENTNLKLYIREKTRQNYAHNLILQNEITRRSNNINDEKSIKAGLNKLMTEQPVNYNDPYENYNTELGNYNGKQCLDTLSKRHRSTSQNKNIDKKQNKAFSNNNLSSYSANLPESGNILTKVKPVYSDDWCDAIKCAGLSISDIEDLKTSKKNEFYQRLGEAFEMFNQVVCDKNVHIDLLIAENEKINTEMLHYLTEIDNLKQKIIHINKNNDNISMNIAQNKSSNNEKLIISAIQNNQNLQDNVNFKKESIKEPIKESKRESIREQIKEDKTIKQSRSTNNIKSKPTKVKMEDKFNEFKMQFKSKLINKNKEKEKESKAIPTTQTIYNEKEVFKAGKNEENISEFLNNKKTTKNDNFKNLSKNLCDFQLSIESIKSNDININNQNDCNLESLQEIHFLKNILKDKKDK